MNHICESQFFQQYKIIRSSLQDHVWNKLFKQPKVTEYYSILLLFFLQGYSIIIKTLNSFKIDRRSGFLLVKKGLNLIEGLIMRKKL